jgi:hypothetical protein
MPETLPNEGRSSAVAHPTFWQSLDHRIGVGFFVVIGGGGILIPLCIMVYSWFQ